MSIPEKASLGLRPFSRYWRSGRVFTTLGRSQVTAFSSMWGSHLSLAKEGKIILTHIKVITMWRFQEATEKWCILFCHCRKIRHFVAIKRPHTDNNNQVSQSQKCWWRVCNSTQAAIPHVIEKKIQFITVHSSGNRSACAIAAWQTHYYRLLFCIICKLHFIF